MGDAGRPCLSWGRGSSWPPQNEKDECRQKGGHSDPPRASERTVPHRPPQHASPWGSQSPDKAWRPPDSVAPPSAGSREATARRRRGLVLPPCRPQRALFLSVLKQCVSESWAHPFHLSPRPPGQALSPHTSVRAPGAGAGPPGPRPRRAAPAHPTVGANQRQPLDSKPTPGLKGARLPGPRPAAGAQLHTAAAPAHRGPARPAPQPARERA